MKRTMMVICIFAALCVMSTVAQGAQTFKSYGVKFNVNPGKGVLYPAQNGKGCGRGFPSGTSPANQGTKMGCVRFDTDDFGLITFHLGPKVDTPVATCSNHGTQWVISMIELSGKGYRLEGGELSNKGEFEGYLPLPDWLKEAFPQVKEDTGILYEAVPPNTGLTHVTRLNLNNKPDTATDPGPPKDIWYRVTAVSCKPGNDAVLVTDPRFENQGKN